MNQKRASAQVVIVVVSALSLFLFSVLLILVISANYFGHARFDYQIAGSTEIDIPRGNWMQSSYSLGVDGVSSPATVSFDHTRVTSDGDAMSTMFMMTFPTKEPAIQFPFLRVSHWDDDFYSRTEVKLNAIVLLVGFALLPLWRFVARPFIRLRRLRRGQCRECGYDLSANTTGVCPECGTKFFEVSGAALRAE